MSKRTNQLAAIYADVLRGDVRRLNWRAMKHYVRRGDFASAAQCRDRVKCWNHKGPV
jgi:hypothetical protein